MRAKAEKTPMCSVSLIAIELKGLAAPGEALKNNHTSRRSWFLYKNQEQEPWFV